MKWETEDADFFQGAGPARARGIYGRPLGDDESATKEEEDADSSLDAVEAEKQRVVAIKATQTAEAKDLTVVLDTPGDSLPARSSDYHHSQLVDNTPRSAYFHTISLWPGNAIEWRGFRVELIEDDSDGVVETEPQNPAAPKLSLVAGQIGPARALAVSSLATMVKAVSKQ
jgi:hypothetical protein